MKLEFRENMYVRTKKGNIYKFETNNYMAKNGAKKYMINCSYNIIDILEVGDYVNGKKIINVIPEDICGDEILDNQHIFTKDGEIFENEIKSIITHEQMEQMAYKVGE